jgi:hypothetical protein
MNLPRKTTLLAAATIAVIAGGAVAALLSQYKARAPDALAPAAAKPTRPPVRGELGHIIGDEMTLIGCGTKEGWDEMARIAKLYPPQAFGALDAGFRRIRTGCDITGPWGTFRVVDTDTWRGLVRACWVNADPDIKFCVWVPRERTAVGEGTPPL